MCGIGDEAISPRSRKSGGLSEAGLAFGSAVVQPIVPELYRPGDGWIVELNSDTLPKVLVNQIYYAEVSATAKRDTHSRRMPAKRHLAGARTRSSRAPTIIKSQTKSCASRMADGDEYTATAQSAKLLPSHQHARIRPSPANTASNISPTPGSELKYFFTGDCRVPTAARRIPPKQYVTGSGN